MISIIVNGLLLGFGLAMDAFSVSLANGLKYPAMKHGKMIATAGTFAIFQGVMPLIGWFLVTRLRSVFDVLEGYIPWASLILLVFIGGKMLFEALAPCKAEDENGAKLDTCPCGELTVCALLLQGVATSIDALSVGLTIPHLTFPEALGEAAIIAALTFIICYAGIIIGKKFGTKLSIKAAILGGIILIAIGFKIFFFG